LTLPTAAVHISTFSRERRHYNNLGVAYADLHQFKQAVKAYQQAVALNPSYSEAHRNLALAYIALNDRTQALGEYALLKKLDEVQAETLYREIYKRQIIDMSYK